MAELDALRTAVYLFHLPSAVRGQRGKPLPTGIQALLEVAAGEAGAAEEAAARLERPVDVIRQACAFFIEQIMLAPDADAYRILGGERHTSDGDLRRNMALLLRWVHPDMDRSGDRTVYAGRVTGAWEALKSQERRAAYDAAHPPAPVSKSLTGSRSRQSRKGPRGPGSQPGLRPDPAIGPGGTAGQIQHPRVALDRKPGLIGSALRFILRRGK
jgi:hypothetical protein